MLYYTSRRITGETDATYSGRFAFIHFSKYEDYLAVDHLRKENDFKNLWGTDKNDQTRKAKGILAHEYTHKHIYALSETGLILNGYRFLVRARFLLFKQAGPLKKYYRMRTIYLMETRPYHERFAQAIDQELNDGHSSIELAFNHTVNSQYNTTIKNQEQVILDAWKQIDGHLSKLTRKFCLRFGRWLQENFAVMLSYRDVEGKVVNGGFADQGVSNDVGTVRPGDSWSTRIQKFLLLHLITLPLNRQESFDTYFEWYWIGQRTQFEILREKYGMEYDQFRDETLGRNALFIMEWAGVPEPRQSTLIQITEDTLLLNRSDFTTKWDATLSQWSHNPYIIRYFCFFHLHGN